MRGRRGSEGYSWCNIIRNSCLTLPVYEAHPSLIYAWNPSYSDIIGDNCADELAKSAKYSQLSRHHYYEKFTRNWQCNRCKSHTHRSHSTYILLSFLARKNSEDLAGYFPMTNIGECYQVHPSRTSKQLYLLDILGTEDSFRALSELLT